jgi:hypothetical protein
MGGFLFGNYGLRGRRTTARLGFLLFVVLAAVLVASVIHGLRSLS